MPRSSTCPQPRIPVDQLDPSTCPTLPIPEAGAYLSLDRNAAYRAARAGFLPTVQISERRFVVPTAALLRLLAVPTAEHAATA